MRLTILTFNWHEPYLCLLAKLDHDFLVVEPEVTSGKLRTWDVNMRPVPPNVRVLSLQDAEHCLEQNLVDLAIAHNIKDLIQLQGHSIPKVIVFHNRLTTELGLSNAAIEREPYLQKIQPLLQGTHRVFISESKRKDWGMEGSVVLPGIDLSDYHGYHGTEKSVLRVGNLFRERDLMMGFAASEQIVAGHPCITLGLNPTVPGSRLSRGFPDLRDHYRKCRAYIHTTVEGYEDGYNLAMLEAMATGMPVVSTFNSTSPIRDGFNGFTSNDFSYLNRCVQVLLGDPDKARELGGNARISVAEQFPIAGFLQNWRRVIQETIQSFLKESGVAIHSRPEPFHRKSKKNILMDYVSYPATTAHYLERALCKTQNVITCGAAITPEIKKAWNLEELNWEVAPQDIFRAPGTPISSILRQLPNHWAPDLYLWVETGLDRIPPDLESLKIPKACYLIDTHIHLEQHKKIAKNFDFVFLAQRQYVQSLQADGCPHVYWLPLACDPEIHGKVETEKTHDIGFVGSVTPSHVRRKRLLDEISGHFDLHVDRKFMDEMARVFSQSRIVFNESIRNDLNMRVFEALCSGSLLVTDEAPGSGLTELFTDQKHLVVFKEENLIETLRYYLDHPIEMTRIAEEGRQEVLCKHTYDHRARTLIETIEAIFKDRDSLQLEAPGVKNEPEKPESYYNHVRQDVLSLVPEKAQCVLEVGCATGQTGKALKDSGNVFVAGIELNPLAAKAARKVLDDVLEGNIEQLELPYAPNSFDCVILGDILEHLVDPLATLKKLRKCMKPDATVIASIPNVQFFGVVNHLVEGNWTYQKEGILDETHLRFFTYKEIEKLFANAGFDIYQVEETLDPQYETFAGGSQTHLKIGRMTISGLSPEELRRFFVFQYKIAARPKALNSDSGLPESEDEIVYNRHRLIQEALFKEKERHFKDAIAIYESAAREGGDCLQTLVGLGNCYMHLADHERAEAHYRRALEMNPDCQEGWFGLGLVLTQCGKWEEALMALNEVVQRNPEHGKALCALGMVFRMMGESERAMGYCMQSLNCDLENHTALKMLLELAYEMNRFEEAETLLARYLELHPANINILFGMAGIQYKMMKNESARETLERLFIFQPDHKDALHLMQLIKQTSAQRQS